MASTVLTFSKLHPQTVFLPAIASKYLLPKLTEAIKGIGVPQSCSNFNSTTDAEPEITIRGCPDKRSNQIQKCSDILKIWSDITTIYANFALFHYK